MRNFQWNKHIYEHEDANIWLTSRSATRFALTCSKTQHKFVRKSYSCCFNIITQKCRIESIQFKATLTNKFIFVWIFVAISFMHNSVCVTLIFLLYIRKNIATNKIELQMKYMEVLVFVSPYQPSPQKNRNLLLWKCSLVLVRRASQQIHFHQFP